ncbi:FadD32-like long-chain-fatty-acid--AMP ligase [Corynebacterium renale]|uniref:Fatty acid CoA ligase FadD32 n=1 Tax=Corynebacterium renale TaxID=1724 RepID=A0A2A9DPI4_9CORY|nr:FadD32-like long-chain-fatty-acid--AMP ligase [Corynebacterium renale]PFG27830.1 fatty acid CoA ligase FadD32 [Corynebacterium renale]SQI22047.1 acyl-CoA synthase [Corynebacterium renale]
MDIAAALKQFYNEKGEIQLAPQLTLAGLAELLYQADFAQGGGQRHVLRFWDFSEGEGTPRDFTRTEVNTRIKAVAARLQQVATIGDRAAILAGNSPEYLFAFLGALYAGVVPVPLYDPNEPGHADHLKAVFNDSEPKVVLTNSASAASVRAYFADLPGRERPRVLSVDSLPDSLAASWVNPAMTLAGQQLAATAQTQPVDSTAFLQYTSGSTRTPAGVALTNRSILTNVLQIFQGARLKMPLRLVSWLPLHHDMGIILAAFVTLLGVEHELFTPRDFIQRPSRWTNLIARRGDEDVATYAVIPNFALELAARYGKPEEGQDFSNVDGVIVGSEPVTRPALENFLEIFGAHGLKREVVRPSYGLAEASLLVTTPQTAERPFFRSFDRAALAEGRAVVVEDGADNGVVFVSNGQVVPNQTLVVVDPETRAEVEDGTIGELWAHGQNMAAGYLNRPEETAATFANTLASRLPEGSHAGTAPDEGWMATGDLGTIVDGHTYITGRLKDLIVIAGRNHYPQDIEVTVGQATDHVNPVAIAAFSVEGDDVEKLIILAERADNADPAGDDTAIETIRGAVNAAHGVAPADIRILGAGEIARSSSAKIARRVARKNYLEQ